MSKSSTCLTLYFLFVSGTVGNMNEIQTSPKDQQMLSPEGDDHCSTWTEEVVEDELGLKMLQVRGSKVGTPGAVDLGIEHQQNADNDDATPILQEAVGNQTQALAVDSNQTAGDCKATFNIQGGITVVLKASTYHFGDFATLSNPGSTLNLNKKITKLVVSASCEAILFSELVYQGDSAKFGAGTHTNVKAKILKVNSVQLNSTAPPTPAPPLPLLPIFKKYEKQKCTDTWEGRQGFQAMQHMMRDKRTCTAEPLKEGGCKDKKTKEIAHYCSFYASHLKPQSVWKAYKPQECLAACSAMKAIAAQVQWNTYMPGPKRSIVDTCSCYFAGPRGAGKNYDEGATICPCGWNAGHGVPKKGTYVVKRGDLIAVPPTPGESPNLQCAPISCDGPDPTTPPTPAPSPLLPIFTKYQKYKCPKTWDGDRGFNAMQKMMRDKRTCTAEPLKEGGCKDKKTKETAHYCSFYASHLKPQSVWKAYKPKECLASCSAMKAIAAQVEWNTYMPGPKRSIVDTCRCFFAGPRGAGKNYEEGATTCPCGWNSGHGVPKKGTYVVKRGDLIAVPPTPGESPNLQCAPISCDGPDPPPPPAGNCYVERSTSCIEALPGWYK